MTDIEAYPLRVGDELTCLDDYLRAPGGTVIVEISSNFPTSWQKYTGYQGAPEHGRWLSANDRRGSHEMHENWVFRAKLVYLPEVDR